MRWLLAPAFLVALGLLVPVLIAFLVRKQRQIVRVPSTMVWRLGARSVAKNKRIRDIRRLLALLACLIGVAALVFASARPTGTRADTRVFVVDVSATMSGAPIAEARGWLQREVAALGPNARVAIITAGAEAHVALPPTPPGPLVDEAIQKLTTEKDVAAIEEAIAIAEGLSANASSANVIVISDQKIDADASRRSTSKPQMVLVGKNAAGSGGNIDNLGITSLYTRTAPDARDDEEREAVITIATASSITRRVRFSLRLGNRTVTDRSVEIPAHGEATERVGIRGPGKLVAKITADDGKKDALSLDDEASLEEIARQPPHVVMVRSAEASDPSSGQQVKKSAAPFFIERAIRASGVTDLIVINADELLSLSDERRCDVAVVLADGPARPRNVPTFYVGVEPSEIELKTKSVQKTETHLRSVATEESLLRGVALDDITTLRAKVATAPMPRGSHALVELDSGPALVTGGSGTHAWVWLGIDPDASDLVLRVAFPVFVGNVMNQLGGGSQVVTAKTVPRSEVMFAANEVSTALDVAATPKWRIPYSPAMILAMAGAFFLALEAWLTFRRKWSAS